uniref:ATPase family AAA domaincontaining protein 3A putat n=1 Tax=Albugo laibachii Nc14 TaxID=890382 RepID=F0WGQ2_9STRA|nr:ATPase family AAA domaincontaining protein 3A putat [Albugo laibachii Nc14]|eukprot:CCA20416.1 ATPase family AAA domaincontaining protein 3A putat [Albugo laibachii Nc14]
MLNIFGKRSPEAGVPNAPEQKSPSTLPASGGSGNAPNPAGAGGYSFDPSGLERAARAARELESSRYAKEAFQIAKEAERTKQIEQQAKVKENEAMYKQYEVMRVQKEGEERRKTLEEETRQNQQRAQYQDQLKRKQYADQLAAQKYMKEQELKKQEEIIARQEAARRKTLDYEAELRQRTELAKVAAEVDGKIKQERLNHDLHLEEARLRAKEYRETVLEGIQVAGSTIGTGLMAFFSDKEKLTSAVVSFTALAVGIYTAKVTTGVAGRYVEARLGKPSLVRETSRRSTTQAILNPIPSIKRLLNLQKPGDPLEGVVLEHKLDQRLRQVAVSTSNTKKNCAPFRHLLLHGPPGTGKTLFAKALARHSGLDYAILTGGDVAPLGREGVTEIHKLFDWASHSRRGLLLFVDEADAFLQKRNNTVMSEDTRNALNAFLYRTGEASDKFMIVFASNQPEQFDWAINDRIDEMVEFALPGQNERVRMLAQYFERLIRNPSNSKYAKPIIVEEDINNKLLESIAKRIKGFSGREIAKLVIAFQAAAYGSSTSIIDKEMMENVLSNHLQAHRQKELWHQDIGPEQAMAQAQKLTTV